MKITKITQQVKNKQRYSVYVDDEYSFSLSEYQLASSGLRKDKELSEEELEQYQDDSTFGKAYERVLNYVMIRPRSRREITEYLTRTFLYPKPHVFTSKKGERILKPKNVNVEKTKRMIERVLERLTEKGYVNDEAFARAWLQSRQLTKSLSLRKLRQELLQKGISSEIIATMLQKEEVNELSNLQQIIVKKRRLPRYQDNEKLLPYLVRQGFSYDDVKTALKGSDYD